MKIGDVIFKPIGLGEPPYKFVKIKVNNPQTNVTGLYSIHNELYRKEYL